jgi:quercetin dioxygenase-like cupin family protein
VCPKAFEPHLGEQPRGRRQMVVAELDLPEAAMEAAQAEVAARHHGPHVEGARQLAGVGIATLDGLDTGLVELGYLTDINGKYKLRVTELTLEPGGYVGEHNHAGPGIRLMTLGEMTYVLPNHTMIYKAGDFFFESGDINHTVYNKTDQPNQHLLFEILPADLKGPSLMPVRKP